MNYGTIIDNQLHPASRAFMLHGAMISLRAEDFAWLNAKREAQALGKTREEIDAFLAQIPQEGGA